MTSASAVFWLCVGLLAVVLVAVALLVVVIDQRDDVRVLREENVHLLDAAAGAASDRERLTGALVENNRLLDELHNLTWRHESLISTFVPDDLSKEDLS